MPVDSLWLSIPLILPFFATAVLLCLGRASERLRLGLCAVTCLMMLAASVVILQQLSVQPVMVLNAGDWPVPLGITLVADLFSASMVIITALIGLVVSIYAIGAGTARFRGYFTPLFMAMLFGVNGAFLTGDLFNLYVWFEVMLMSSFILIALPGGRRQLQGALKYLVLNFIASLFFLIGLGVLYGLVGTLNMSDLALKLANHPDQLTVRSTAVLFLVAFGIKAGMFPFYFWLPSSYHVTPTPVAAVFAALLTKVGVYALVRAFALVFHGQQEFIGDILLPLGILTMLTGVLGAASQFYIPRILSFHIISQIGYMVVGLAFFTKAAMAATVFYVLHHILVKANLFLIGGIIGRKLGTQALKKTGGLYQHAPALAVLFLIPAMSLGGIPPLSGFFAKFALIREGIALNAWFTVFMASAVGLLTLYSMIKIWNEAFWKSPPSGEPIRMRPVPWTMTLPAIGLALCTVLFGLFPGTFFAFAERAADQLMNPSIYTEAVSGKSMPTPNAP
ncbi:MAG: Na+/H+ antiporter subunit D [Verrucomicrobia bacterium]|nr:MAG: Na+/H+ antiporter subunit D [Verrucomicrobiota bacterium]